MKSTIANALDGALAALPELADAADGLEAAATVERTRDPSHGDFASNIAMRLAKTAGRKPRDVAAEIVDALGENAAIEKVAIAGPGFINFHLSPAAFHAEVGTILDRGTDYGRQPARERPRILLEFVSANPTGPLHVGHGRHAAYGATLGNLLEAAGYPVTREYYVNDAGRQMDILGVSVWLRWLERNDIDVPFPAAGYRGDYIREVAEAIDTTGIGTHDAATILDGLPEDVEGTDPDDRKVQEAASGSSRWKRFAPISRRTSPSSASPTTTGSPNSA